MSRNAIFGKNDSVGLLSALGSNRLKCLGTTVRYPHGQLIRAHCMSNGSRHINEHESVLSSQNINQSVITTPADSVYCDLDIYVQHC